MWYTRVMTPEQAIERLQAMKAQLTAIENEIGVRMNEALEAVRLEEIRVINERIARIA